MSQVHGPAATAPTTTDIVCHCKLCGSQWAKRGPGPEACAFCGAPSNAVRERYEGPSYSNYRRDQRR